MPAKKRRRYLLMWKKRSFVHRRMKIPSFHCCLSKVFLYLQIILEAIPKDETDQARRYRGYVAVDDLFFQDGEACQGHCTFDSGMCGFSNDQNDDDFDWEVVSENSSDSVNIPDFKAKIFKFLAISFKKPKSNDLKSNDSK